MCAVFAVIILGFLCSTGISTNSVSSEKLQYCSFFNNRAPSAQPGLKNCTWFKDNSCCMQQEIAATFGRVKPLKGASLACQKYVNYLMCYICAPNQNIFYKQERLTVCRSFCDALYDSCNSAILKGSVIRDLYSSGEEFCQSRRFEVATTGCFTFDVSLDTSSAVKLNTNSLFLIVLVFISYLVSSCGRGDSGMFSWDAIERRRGKISQRGKRRGTARNSTTLRGDSDTNNTDPSRSCSRKSSSQSHDGVGESHPSAFHKITPSPSCGRHKKTDTTVLAQFDCPNPPPLLLCSSSTISVPMAALKHKLHTTNTSNQNLIGTTKPVMQHPKQHLFKMPPWINSAFLTVALISGIIFQAQGAGALSERDIETWAQLLSSELTDIAKRGLRYEEIQQLYDRAQYATEYVNGTAKVLEVRKKLGTWNFTTTPSRTKISATKNRSTHSFEPLGHALQAH